MPNIPGLRSCYDKVGRLIYFGRMLDKIRLHAAGQLARNDEECHVWNRFIAKRGWRDERSHVLPQRIKDAGLTGNPIETLIDQIEFDEGRDPGAARAWEKI
jgi:gluconokinase